MNAQAGIRLSPTWCGPAVEQVTVFGSALEHQTPAELLTLEEPREALPREAAECRRSISALLQPVHDAVAVNVSSTLSPHTFPV